MIKTLAERLPFTFMTTPRTTAKTRSTNRNKTGFSSGTEGELELAGTILKVDTADVCVGVGEDVKLSVITGVVFGVFDCGVGIGVVSPVDQP